MYQCPWVPLYRFDKPTKPLFLLFALWSSLSSAATVLSLDDFIRLALRQSDQAYNLADNIASGELDVAAAAHTFDLAWVPLARIGTLSGEGRQELGIEGRTRTLGGTTFSAGVSGTAIQSDTTALTNTHSARAYVRLSQGLFRRWGERYNRAGLTLSELKQRKVLADTERSRQDIVLDSVRKYYATVLAQYAVSVSGQALKRSRETLDAARARQAAGLVSKQDVFRSELAALGTENRLQDKRRSLRNVLETLHEQVGLSGTDRIAVKEAIREFVAVVPPDWEKAALDLRPDWQSHLIALEMSDLGLYKARRDLLPDLSLSVVVEQKGLGDSWGEAAALDERDWSVQLELRSTFDDFQEKDALSRARINADRLRRDGNSLKRRVRREAREAMEDLKAEERRGRIARQRLEQARGSLELARIRYQRGLSDNLDLVDAESALSEAEMDIARSQADFNVAVVRFGHALGVLTPQWLRLVQGGTGPRAAGDPVASESDAPMPERAPPGVVTSPQTGSSLPMSGTAGP